MGRIYGFDIGTRLRTTLDVDLTGNSTIEYKIEKPGGSVLTKTCSVEDLANGIIYYDTILNDLDELGIYHIQVQVVFASGSQFESETMYFTVHDSFE